MLMGFAANAGAAACGAASQSPKHEGNNIVRKHDRGQEQANGQKCCVYVGSRQWDLKAPYYMVGHSIRSVTIWGTADRVAAEELLLTTSLAVLNLTKDTGRPGVLLVSSLLRMLGQRDRHEDLVQPRRVRRSF